MILRLTLPFASPSQNELDRWHWTKKRKLRDQCRLLIASQMRIAGIAPDAPPQEKRAVQVIRQGRKTLDYGNLVGGFKPILDALRLEYLLYDDSPQWVEDKYTQVLSRQPHGATIITVSEIL